MRTHGGVDVCIYICELEDPEPEGFTTLRTTLGDTSRLIFITSYFLIFDIYTICKKNRLRIHFMEMTKNFLCHRVITFLLTH